MRRAARVDATQAEIVRVLEQLGASVVDLSGVGGGVPDLLVGWQGRGYLVEVKTATGTLRASQLVFASAWRGAPVVVLRSEREAERWLCQLARRGIHG